MKIFPSLISADVLDLKAVLATFNTYCDGYHIDVMDDHFVPNLTWGPTFVRAIANATSLPIHLHLMVDNPEVWVDRIALSKNDVFIFHYEVFSQEREINDFLEKLKKVNGKIGIAVNPETAVEKIVPYIDFIDHVLIMSVNPGFSGQKFIPDVLGKASCLVELRNKRKIQFTIGMDGGIGLENIKKLADVGVDEIGVASSIFSAADPVFALKNLYKKV